MHTQITCIQFYGWNFKYLGLILVMAHLKGFTFSNSWPLNVLIREHLILFLPSDRLQGFGHFINSLSLLPLKALRNSNPRRNAKYSNNLKKDLTGWKACSGRTSGSRKGVCLVCWSSPPDLFKGNIYCQSHQHVMGDRRYPHAMHVFSSPIRDSL